MKRTFVFLAVILTACVIPAYAQSDVERRMNALDIKIEKGLVATPETEATAKQSEGAWLAYFEYQKLEESNLPLLDQYRKLVSAGAPTRNVVIIDTNQMTALLTETLKKYGRNPKGFVAMVQPAIAVNQTIFFRKDFLEKEKNLKTLTVVLAHEMGHNPLDTVRRQIIETFDVSDRALGVEVLEFKADIQGATYLQQAGLNPESLIMFLYDAKHKQEIDEKAADLRIRNLQYHLREIAKASK